MLWQLVAKLLFKACVPLVLLVGVLTYGYYLQGGDPGALWEGVAGRASNQVTSLFSGVREDASRTAGVLTRGAASVSGDEADGQLTQVYMWKDANGVTHYSSEEPAGVRATALSVDPNVNVLAPVRAPVIEPGRTDSSAAGIDTDSEAVGQLPGVAGQILSTRSDRHGGTGSSDPASGATIDPAQLLRMLQAADR